MKLEVHHRNGVKWDELINLVFKYLLCDPADLEVLCDKCHAHTHDDEDEWLK